MFRKHGRTVIQCPVLLKHRSIGAIEALTRDISSGGMFVGPETDIPDETIEDMSLDDEVEVYLANAENVIERMQLKIARVADDGWGLTFVYGKNSSSSSY